MAASLSEEILRSIEYPEGATFVSVQELSADRRAVYANAVSVESAPMQPLAYSQALPGFDQGEVAAVLCELDGEKVQHLVYLPPGGSPTVAMLSCKILMEDLSPTQLVEYRFRDGTWRLSGMGPDACEMYRGQKWQLWLKGWKEPECKAALVRMIQTGLANCLFDTSLLPSPENEMSQWMVTDPKNGKITYVPRPVEMLRRWNAEAGDYESISPHLTGAPTDAEFPQVWGDMLEELKGKFIDIDRDICSGADLVAQALSASG